MVTDGEIDAIDDAGEVGAALVDVVGALTLVDGDGDSAGWEVADRHGPGVILAGGPAVLVCRPQPAIETVTAQANTTDALAREEFGLIAHPLSTP